jgi:hypothetical protein
MELSSTRLDPCSSRSGRVAPWAGLRVGRRRRCLPRVLTKWRSV